MWVQIKSWWISLCWYNVNDEVDEFASNESHYADAQVDDEDDGFEDGLNIEGKDNIDEVKETIEVSYEATKAT